MKAKFMFLVLILCFFLPQLSAQEIESTEEVLKAIEVIEKDPANTDFNDSIKVVVKFAMESEDVTVVLNPKILPWIESNDKSEKLNQLMGVFIAGNIKNQLITKTNKDNAFEGLKLVLKIYKLWRADNQIIEIPELEKWSALSYDDLKKIL